MELQENRQPNEYKEANEKILRIGDLVRFSEKGRQELLNLNPVAMRLISFRGHVVGFNQKGGALVQEIQDDPSLGGKSILEFPADWFIKM